MCSTFFHAFGGLIAHLFLLLRIFLIIWMFAYLFIHLLKYILFALAAIAKADKMNHV